MQLNLLPIVKTQYHEAGGLYDADASYTNFVGRSGMTRSQMTRLFPNWHLPGEITEEGWSTLPTRETDNECRQRAKEIKLDLFAKAASIEDDMSILVVTHYDMICALLDELIVLERPGDVKGPFKNWKTFNTGITVVDITAEGETSVLVHNAVSHLHEDLGLVTGFPL